MSININKKIWFFLSFFCLSFFSVPSNDNFVRIEQGNSDNGMLIETFLISKTEVTLAQMLPYCLANQKNDNNLTIKRFNQETRTIDLNRAAVNITWYDAIRYCNWLSKEAGFKELPYKAYYFSNNDSITYLPLNDKRYWTNFPRWYVEFNDSSKGFRLPTKEEWNLAANNNINEENLKNFAWFKDNSNKQVKIVGTLNSYNKLFDMMGNISEWCFEPSETQQQTVKGGNWSSEASNCKIEQSNKVKISSRKNTIGFRLARSL